MHNSVFGFYFSPTGGTEKCAKAAAYALSSAPALLDCTVPGRISPRIYSQDDFVVFGAPVYAGRLPDAFVDALKTQQGSGTPCYILVSYGNRHYDDALLELQDMVQAQGFVVKGAAAMVAKHTYGTIAVGRPDEESLSKLAEHVKAAAAFTGDVSLPGNRPYREGMHKGHFPPYTTEECISCGLCVRNCPMAAIAEDCRSISDKCISCLRCVNLCPAGAKSIDTPEYRQFAEDFSAKMAVAREDEFWGAEK